MSWEQLKAIRQDNIDELAARRKQPPECCPNDGTILDVHDGVYHCPHDGWVWSGSPLDKIE